MPIWLVFLLLSLTSLYATGITYKGKVTWHRPRFVWLIKPVAELIAFFQGVSEIDIENRRRPSALTKYVKRYIEDMSEVDLTETEKFAKWVWICQAILWLFFCVLSLGK